MKVSVSVTVFNEEASVGRLLDSLLEQTKKPDEIIIVDGGSKDRTLNIVNRYAKSDKRIKVYSDPGPIAYGRNVSIRHASGDVIATTDAGCTAKKDWLEKITKPFEDTKTDLVAGFYLMRIKTPMQNAMVVYHGIPPERFDPKTFLPSARSMAFRKEVWEKLGGFDESLERAGEDTLFLHKAQVKNMKIVRVKDAIVYWEEPREMTMKSSMKKFYGYAKGDVSTGMWWSSKGLATHNLKVLSVVLRYAMAMVLIILSFIQSGMIVPFLLLALLYAFWAIWKWRDVIKDWRARLWLPVVQVSSDVAVISGFIAGMLR